MVVSPWFTLQICILTRTMIEGSLEVKLPTIWTDEKQRWEESDKRREEERESLRRKKIQVREKVGKSRVGSPKQLRSQLAR